MDPGPLDRRLDELEAAMDATRKAMLRVETGHCSIAQLGRIRSLMTGMRNTLDGINTDIALRADELRRGGNSHPVDDAMNPGGRESPAAERSDKARGEVFDAIPGLENATRSGELSGRYSDIVAKALEQLDREVRDEFFRRHQDLAEDAAAMTQHAFRLHVQHLVERLLHDCGVERAERQRRNRRASTWTELGDGMWCLRGSWDPETGAAIGSALDAEVNAIVHARRDDPTDTRSRGQILADAVANLIRGTAVSQRARPGGATVLVITDRETIATGVHDQSVHEYGAGTPVAAVTLRRIADNPTTDLQHVTVNEHGVVIAVGNSILDEGRNRRFATPTQRLALRAMYRTCMVPECDVPFDACEVHHLIDWELDGPTDMQNLGPLCSRHHHLVHAEGWTIRLDPATRQLTITDCEGHTQTHPFRGLAPPGRRRSTGDVSDTDRQVRTRVA